MTTTVRTTRARRRARGGPRATTTQGCGTCSCHPRQVSAAGGPAGELAGAHGVQLGRVVAALLVAGQALWLQAQMHRSASQAFVAKDVIADIREA